MSRGLKALKRIEDFLKVNTPHWKQDVEYIEKELKALEIASRGFNMWVEEIKDCKGNPIYRLALCYNLSDRFYLNITKEEYKLLKEVLR